MELTIGVDDPAANDVHDLLRDHLAFARGATPAAYSFALDADELVESGVTFFTARRKGVLVAIGALKRIDDGHAELKSMHTRESQRGRGAGKAMVEHVLGEARLQGYRRVSLETGSTDEFVAARVLYTKMGFRPCAPFGDYEASAYNTFMTIELDPGPGPAREGPIVPDGLAGGAGIEPATS